MTDKKTAEITKVDSAYYLQRKNIGMQEMDETDIITPTISIVQPTSKAKDINGAPFKRGTYFYKAENTVHEKLDVVFLSFTKKELPDYMDKTFMVKNYIFIGVIMPEMKPFKWYLNKGAAIYQAKDFFSKVKFLGRPMYTVQVSLSLTHHQNDKGEWYNPKFDVTSISDEGTILALEKMAISYDNKLKSEVVETEMVGDLKENKENADLDDFPY